MLIKTVLLKVSTICPTRVGGRIIICIAELQKIDS